MDIVAKKRLKKICPHISLSNLLQATNDGKPLGHCLFNINYDVNRHKIEMNDPISSLNLKLKKKVYIKSNNLPKKKIFAPLTLISIAVNRTGTVSNQ